VNILFICSRNKWRSPTAEHIYKNYPGIRARSAGTSDSAVVKVSLKMVLWADKIFVMQKKHLLFLISRFTPEIQSKKIIVLDIEDEYEYMDEDLIDDLKSKVDPHL
jgi:predicted protein tyrosine phosphatase